MPARVTARLKSIKDLYLQDTVFPFPGLYTNYVFDPSYFMKIIMRGSHPTGKENAGYMIHLVLSIAYFDLLYIYVYH